MSKNQSNRLTTQHEESGGAVGIFGAEAKRHDTTVADVARLVVKRLQEAYPQLSFRHRKSIRKEEINAALRRIDPELGQTLFVLNANIIPDGGLIEVKDDWGNWRIVLVAEAKHQGRTSRTSEPADLWGKRKIMT